MKKQLGIIGVVALALLLVFGLRAGKKLSYEALEKNEAFLEMQLQIVARDINARLPKDVNDTLRLDETRAGPGKVFASYFTLLTYPLDALDQQKRDALAAADLKSTCSADELKPLLEAGVHIVHHYRSQDGQDAFSLTLTSETCASEQTES